MKTQFHTDFCSSNDYCGCARISLNDSKQFHGNGHCFLCLKKKEEKEISHLMFASSNSFNAYFKTSSLILFTKYHISHHYISLA